MSIYFMKNIKGFSLIELMITVAIIGILSMIALPLYNGYIGKSRNNESNGRCRIYS